MPVAPTALGWLKAPAPPSTLPPRPPANSDSQDLPANNAVSDIDGSSASTKPRRRWAEPTPVNEQRGCCSGLTCVRKFITNPDAFHARALEKEQEAIRACKSRLDRKRFVYARVPVVDLGRGGGSMLAGGIPVCTKFFKASFGVSNHVIDACKGTSCARATSGVGSR